MSHLKYFYFSANKIKQKFYQLKHYFSFRTKLALNSIQNKVATLTKVASSKSQAYPKLGRTYHVQPGKAENTDSGVESIGMILNTCLLLLKNFISTYRSNIEILKNLLNENSKLNDTLNEE